MPLKQSAWPIAVGLVGALLFTALASGTPLYSARSGRTCDNCHVTPNEWMNPRLADRKCTLSCQSCHVDPAGGGMRNASGRFYGGATLPMIATSPRPTADWDRNTNAVGRHDRATTYNDSLQRGPASYQEIAAFAHAARDEWAWGNPLGSPPEEALFPGRFGDLRADPLFRIGVDLRLAMLVSGTALPFPMQVDVPFVFHPIHRLSVFVNTGFRGRSSGYSDTFDDSHKPYFREAFVLLHEAPFQSYLKAGRFVPSYGLRLDDHTSRIRREFELDGSLPESRVTGVEFGLAPNYPFLQASYFRSTDRSREPDPWNPFDHDDGSGKAVNLGYRNEGWTIAGSCLMRQRPLEEGGDATTFGGYGVYNLWRYRDNLPFTYQVELDYGTYDRASGNESSRAAFYQEVDWLLYNGINLLLAHDWADPDREIVSDESHRVAAGVQVTPYPGLTVDTRLRMLRPAGGQGTGVDLFIQLHVWN